MKATEASLLEFLRKSPQFVVPIYQRSYSWTEKECQQLWDDILRSGNDDTIRAHFIGSIVYIQQGILQVASQSRLLVIDGQQRLTTIMLVLEALAIHLPPTEPVPGFSAKKIRHYYLLNPLEEGEQSFKLILTQTDKLSLLRIMQQDRLPDNPSLNISHNFRFFKRKIEALGEDLGALCKGLQKLMIVDISLHRGQDNPQLIFESMNSTGRDLSQADLIRNFVLMGLDTDEQARIYNKFWRPMETEFGQAAYGKHFDSFMRHYLTFRTGVLPKIKAVYEAFKRYAHSSHILSKGVDTLVADVHKYANYYCAMGLGKEKDENLAPAFQYLRELRVDVTFPLLLEIYGDYQQGLLTAEELVEAVELVESYLFRRAVCTIPTNSHNKTFATFSRSIDKDRYIDSIRAHFYDMRSYRRFPKDEEFRRELETRDLCNCPRRSYWLRRLENYGRKEPVPVDEYTIEHIMPQNPKLSDSWKTTLGENWQHIHATWLHTLGNLTLTGYNTEYSDHSFERKREMPGGFRESPLRINDWLRSRETWDEDAIRARSKLLSERATTIWPRPILKADLVRHSDSGATLVSSDQAFTYALDKFSHLRRRSPMRPIFEELRRAIVDLNPCISEEVLKHYIAYKAETNFVDIIPRQGQLVLILNMRFHELHDPKGVARDVTNVGRLGNGDVEIHLDSPDELSYTMGLVRQSFEN